MKVRFVSERAIENHFVLFGADHLWALVVCAAACVLSYQWGRKARQSNRTTPNAIGLAVLLVALEAVKTHQELTVYGQPWQAVLPLHLCRISAYLCCLMLLFRSYRLFEVAYFWGIGGSVAALLTPDLNIAFPHALFIGFFLGHALVLCSVFFAVGAYGFEPRLRSVGIAAVVTAIYMSIVALINLALDTNYLYLSNKPASTTAYEYLGPWPWYLLSVWLIGLALAFVLYAPFGWRNRNPEA